MTEIWADVNGYEGLYMVSNFGNVMSLRRTVRQGKYGKSREVEERILKPHDNGNGYLLVFLTQGCKKKNFYIHRLVAEHFVPNTTDGEYVNHKDFNKYNNRADNLEWCTQRENIRHSSDRMRKPHKQWKQSGTGEKYIYHRYGKYRLSIKGHIDKCFPTLEEAVCAREVILSGKKYIAG